MRPHATAGPPPLPDEGGRGPLPRPWLAWPVGVRVVVRRTVEGGYSDVLGELLARDADGVQVRTRRGDVHVPAEEIAVGKIVPPAPPRRRRDRSAGQDEDQAPASPDGGSPHTTRF